MYRHFFKRTIDFSIALIGFILASPIFIVITIWLHISNNGKPFFVQQRPGRNGRIFKIMKFKSMNDRRDEHGHLLSDAERLTTVGRIIRKTSLDELPQLINVIKGDMSLIGPRPLLVEYLPLYSEEQRKRHLVRPGITGWAQVNGRNAITWQEKFDLDVYYVNHVSFCLDCRIILKTVSSVLQFKDINASANVPMEKFKGNG